MKRIMTKFSSVRPSGAAEELRASASAGDTPARSEAGFRKTGMRSAFGRVAGRLPVLISMLCAALFFSCTDDSVDEKQRRSRDGKTELIFSLNIPKSSDYTRAMGDKEENAVNAVKVLVFEQGGGFKYMVTASQISSSGSDPKVKMFRADLDPGLVDIVFLANADSWLEAAYPGEDITAGTTRAQLTDNLKVTMSGKWKADKTSPSGYTAFPMWGEMNDVDLEPGYTTLSQAASLLRMVARVNLSVSSAAQPVFKLKSVRVFNYNSIGQLIPAAANWDAGTEMVTAPSVPEQSKVQGPLEFLQSDPNTTLNDVACNNEIYIFEALKGNATDYMQNTCLVIGGVFADDPEETYYRIDFANRNGNDVTYIDIMRNHTYNINIAQVSGSGYSILSNALTSMPMNIDADVLVWDEANMNNVVFDGQYLMSVDPIGTYLQAGASTGNTVKVVTNYPQWSYSVSYAGSATGWLTVTSPTTPASNPGSLAGTVLSYSVVANTLATTRVAYIDIKAGRLVMRVTVTQAAASITPILSANCYILKPSQSVTIPVARAFDAWAGALLNEPLNANWKITVEPLWKDNTNLNYTTSFVDNVNTGSNANIVVQSTSTVEGNAVFAVRIGPNGNSQDPIRWSWHLWVTNYNPESITTGTTYTHNSYVFMNRNLGAWDNAIYTGTVGDPYYFGMMYQWGRKDPFPPAKTGKATQPLTTLDAQYSVSANEVPTYGNYRPVTDYANVVNVANNLGNSIMNPYIYYFSGLDKGSDWYTNSIDLRNNYLWNNLDGTKTIYDPCPAGWRVPAFKNGISPWSGWPSTGNSFTKGGWTFSNRGFWPAAGYRPGYDTIWGLAAYPVFNYTLWQGIYWSGSPVEPLLISSSYLNAYAFTFSWAGYQTQNNFMRSGGASIRCVKE